ncbi:hypothetical protein GCM10022395_31160 [Snuella lapsa]|uniref:Uncharacterized protein n=1 Tax=Snuella lapsa TaxID=870481 RepID=A0ABP6YBC0_9FLAO
MHGTIKIYIIRINKLRMINKTFTAIFKPKKGSTTIEIRCSCFKQFTNTNTDDLLFTEA